MRTVGWKHRTQGTALVCLGLLLGSGVAAVGAQEEAPTSEVVPHSPRKPVLTVLGGLGSSYGGFGAQAEYYLGGGRFSVFGGVGYHPAGEDDRYPSGLAGAGGARLYAGGARHRGFLEVAVSPIADAFVAHDDELVDQTIVYGPSVQLGCQLVRTGFTFRLRRFGYGRWGEYDLSVTASEGLGIGHTWR